MYSFAQEVKRFFRIASAVACAALKKQYICADLCSVHVSAPRFHGDGITGTIAKRLRTSAELIVVAGALARAQVLHAGMPVLTRVQQVRALAPEQARRGYPVHLRVVVTYFDSVAPNLFVQDSTGALWVDWPRNRQELLPGQLIDLQGINAQPSPWLLQSMAARSVSRPKRAVEPPSSSGCRSRAVRRENHEHPDPVRR